MAVSGRSGHLPELRAVGDVGRGGQPLPGPDHCSGDELAHQRLDRVVDPPGHRAAGDMGPARKPAVHTYQDDRKILRRPAVSVMSVWFPR